MEVESSANTASRPGPFVTEGGGPLPGDAKVPGGTFMLGAAPDEPFVFDNEMWGHALELRPVAIARAAVTQAEYAAFGDDGATVGPNSGAPPAGTGARPCGRRHRCTGAGSASTLAPGSGA